MAGDDHQLARDRDGRDVAAAKGGDASMKGAQGGRACGPCATRPPRAVRGPRPGAVADAVVLGWPTDLLGQPSAAP